MGENPGPTVKTKDDWDGVLSGARGSGKPGAYFHVLMTQCLPCSEKIKVAQNALRITSVSSELSRVEFCVPLP